MSKRSTSKIKVQQINDKSSFTKPSRPTVKMLGIIIFLITFMVYTPTLKNDFINWDDNEYVYENSYIRSFNLQSLYWMLTSFHAANWHPFTWVSHAIDYALWKLKPWGHHLTNIILHGFNTLLIFFLVIQLIIKEKEANRMPLSSKILYIQVLIAASVTALLFGLHPLHVESVAWVAERKDLLCAFFFLLTLLSYLSFTSSVRKKNRWTWFTTCLILFMCALMSKPMAVTLPVVLLLVDIYPLKRISLNASKNNINLSILLEKIPFFVLSLVSSIVTIIAQHSEGAIKSFEYMPLSSRLVNALHALIFYVVKMFWPYKLSPFYPFPLSIHPFDLQYIISGMFFLVITGLSIWKIKKGNYLFCTVWLYYLITLLPVIGIIQVGVQAAADRYTYLPSVSIFLLVGVGVSWVFERVMVGENKAMFGSLVLALICTVMFLLGHLTIKQIKIWRNPEIFWSYSINLFPRSVPLEHIGLGLAYFDQGKLDEAITAFSQALAIDPNNAMAHRHLGNAYDKTDRIDEAIEEYTRALAINPDFAEAHYNLGNAYDKKGRIDEAIEEYTRALAIDPDFAEAHTNLGNVYSTRGDVDKAIAEYECSLSIDSYNTFARHNLATIYFKKGMVAKAIEEYKITLKINPDLAETHNNLGRAYAKKGMIDEAMEEYKRALKINPDYALAHDNISVSYYYKGNYKLAIIHLDKAAALGYKISPQFFKKLQPYREQ